MMKVISDYDIPVLEMEDEAERMAGLYVAGGVVPERYYTDGLYIAIASVNGLDMVVSMNFQHIVKIKTEKMTSAINTLNGYPEIKIASPMEVIESDNI